MEAISYKRFSSPKQARGDSDRRQTDLTEEYCQRHHLRLIDTYLDAGLSGFTGENLNDGSALTTLLHAAKLGKFKPGTRLIVESLDRLSRREISMAVRLFLDILDIGLVIVTLIDGEQVFTKERVDTDLTALIIAIVYLSRANNESKNRRERALQAQQTARKNAREHKIPITAECPSWLTVAKKRGARCFVVKQDRARIIENIFQMVVSGMGQPQIARFLNQHMVPTFSGKPKWRPGMIAHLLANQAVVGRFHPCLSVVEDGRRRRAPDPEGPIENYFPAVISKELFEQARLATGRRRSHRGERRIPAYSNLVVRIGRCAVCGAALHHEQSSGGWAYLRCSDAHDKNCSNRFGFPYRKLESVLFALDDLTELVAKLTSSRATEKQQEMHCDRFEDRKAFLVRFKAITASAEATDTQERDLGRRALIAELRTLIEGVVLHPNRTMTIHLKPDAAGCRVVCVVGRDGIQGIQLKMPEGTTGFIGPSILGGLVRPVKNGAHTPIRADDQPWRPHGLDGLLKRIRIIDSPDGDWQAVVPDPMQMAEVVVPAERALGPR